MLYLLPCHRAAVHSRPRERLATLDVAPHTRTVVALLLLVFSPTIECGMAALQSAAAHLTAGYPLDTRGVELLLRLLHAAAYKIYAMRDRCGAVACQVSLFGG